MVSYADGNTTLAALAHASTLVASFFGPILFLLLSDDDDELVRQNAKNAINFQIIIFLSLLISGILVFLIIGLFLLPLIFVLDLILVIIATVKANNNEIYKYPLTPDIV